MIRTFAAAAVLALCGCHDEPEILVHNQGGQPALVEIISDDFTWHDREHDLIELAPGAIYTNDYPGDEVEVLIWRKSDGLILFAAVYDREDFEDDHGTIEIVVTP
jgi:hypothetical protein